MAERVKVFTQPTTEEIIDPSAPPMMANSVLARTQRQGGRSGMARGWAMAIPFGVVIAVAAGVFAYTQMNRQQSLMTDATPTPVATNTDTPSAVSPAPLPTPAPAALKVAPAHDQFVAADERPVMPATRSAVRHHAAAARASAPSATSYSSDTSATAPTAVNPPMPPAPVVIAPPPAVQPAPAPAASPVPDATPSPQ